jgi:hypothetical protein
LHSKEKGSGHLIAIFSSFLASQSPECTVKLHQAISLENLLSRTDKVLPFLSKALSIDYPVHRVVAEVRMNPLDLRMQLDGP